MGKRGPKKKEFAEKEVFDVKCERLNLGCGHKLMDGFLNVDKLFGKEGVKYVDLEKGFLPFPDESCVEVRADHVMEHINNFIPLMNECWRVLKPKGTLEIVVPVLPNLEAFQDPTHVRFFTDRTFLYFVGSEYLWKNNGESYGIKPFKILNQSKVGFELVAVLQK